MKKKLVLAILLSAILISSAALADGDFYVGGPWGTRITSLPFTISAPGSYYLAGSLTYSGTGNAISVNTGINDVTLDLMGFSITGSGSGNGIYMSGSKNVEIRNGTVTGFAYGINESGSSGVAHRIINVRAVGNTNGIYLYCTGNLVAGCEASETGSGNYAIYIGWQAIISGCTVTLDSGNGIMCSGTVRDNVVIGNSTTGTGISAWFGSLVKGNEVKGCATGIVVAASSSASVIGNTVTTPAASATGISLTSGTAPNMLDQNTVSGPGTPATHYSGTGAGTKARVNGNAG